MGITAEGNRQPLTSPPSILAVQGQEAPKREFTSEQGSHSAKINSIRRACAQSIFQLIPRPVALALFAIPNDKEIFEDGATNSLLSAEQRCNPASHRPPQPADAVAVAIANAPPTPVLSSLDFSTPSSGAVDTEVRLKGIKTDSNPSRSNPGAITGILTPNSASGGIKTERRSRRQASRSMEKAGLTSLGRPLSQEEEDRLCCAAIERDLLDLFADSYCNKHLIYSIVEAVLVKLIPELAEHSVGELMAERGL